MPYPCGLLLVGPHCFGVGVAVEDGLPLSRLAGRPRWPGAPGKSRSETGLPSVKVARIRRSFSWRLQAMVPGQVQQPVRVERAAAAA